MDGISRKQSTFFLLGTIVTINREPIRVVHETFQRFYYFCLQFLKMFEFGKKNTIQKCPFNDLYKDSIFYYPKIVTLR